jgi:DNA polymerase III epsilon subunit-like protein
MVDAEQPEATDAMFDAAATAPDPWWKRRMCGLDCETTRELWDPREAGPNVQEERIVSCGIALVGGGGETWSHTWLVNPGFAIPPESSAIHGIYDQDVADAPSWEDVAEEVLDLLWEAANERMALVVYNAPFDCTVLDRNLRRAGIDPSVLAQLWAAVRCVDPMLLDRMLDTFRKGSRKLADTAAIWNARAARAQAAAGREWKPAALLDRAHKGTHDAAEDAIAVCRMAWLMRNFGCVYSYDRPVWENRKPDRDLMARQVEWEAVRDDLEGLHEWQRRWRYDDQLRLKAHWESRGNPKAEGVRPEWPVYPQGVKVG